MLDFAWNHLASMESVGYGDIQLLITGRALTKAAIS